MKKIIVYILILVPFVAGAQKKDKNIPKGNDFFMDNKYSDAEADYRISESLNPKNSIASYNLGNSIYKQNQAAESKYHYLKAIKNAKTKAEKHKAFHNLGNTFMKSKAYSAAVEAYKNALRNDPSDEESRYNLALAKKMHKENPPKKEDQKKDKKDEKKDEKKENNKEDKKEDKKENEKEDKKEKKENDKDQNNEKPNPQPNGISKQRLENLLDAVNNEEKKVQDKVNKQKVQTNPKKAEKDW